MATIVSKTSLVSKTMQNKLERGWKLSRKCVREENRLWRRRTNEEVIRKYGHISMSQVLGKIYERRLIMNDEKGNIRRRSGLRGWEMFATRLLEK